MLLQRLKEFADLRMRDELPPRLYSETPVRYIVELDADGRPLGVTDTADPSSPRTKRGARRLMPQVSRSVGIQPLLLADNAEYTLGLAREGSRSERVAACHQSYLALAQRCAATVGNPVVDAVLAFLQGEPARMALPDEFDRSALITFRVGSVFPTELPDVQSFWAAEHTPTDEAATVMQCIVCGNERPVLDRLQGKIKGVPGGQTAGTALISANAEAFESYGLEASLVAPTCADCGERFTKALNYLLASDLHRVIIANSAFVFWTRDVLAFDFGSMVKEPSTQQVAFLLRGLREGRFYGEQVDTGAFYSVVLSASGGRTVIRDWVDTTVGAALAHLGHWFQWQAIGDDRGGEARPLGLYQLAGATVRELRDLPVSTPRALLRSAFTSTPLPLSLLYQAVRRSRAEQSVTRPRAALIKLVLNSRAELSKEPLMTADLDPNLSDPAYRYGRLLAVLADAQEAAIGKAAIIDRFYGTASSAPGSVFPRLLRGARPHLAKLERDRPGIAFILEQRLEEVMHGVATFLPILTLEQQGRFALGFYHQRAHDRAERKAAAERKAEQKRAEASGTFAFDE
jgi:CRISPR-associated protein Csd1